MKCLVVIAALFVLPAAPSAAQDFRAGLSAYNIRDYPTALSHWRALADLNRPKAQSGLGYLYYRGLGVRRDSVRAAHWFRRAAEQGEPNAQLFLGMMRFFGDGVPRDLELALMWCELSLSGGQPDALDWREDVLEAMTPAQRDAGWRRTAEWYETHDTTRAD